MALRLTSEAEFRRMAQTILAAGKADDVFVNFDDSESSTLRFANNQVVQNVSVHDPGVTIRAAFGHKHGTASTNRLDEASLLETLRKAEEIARLAPEDPEYMPPLAKQEYIRVPSYRSSTAGVTPRDAARRVGPVIADCERGGLVGAGILTNSVSAGGLAASSGLVAYEQSTAASFSLTATADDSSGWAYNSHRDIDALGIDRRTKIAVEKAVRSKSPTELPAGHYPVILEPAAVAGILGPMSFGLGAKNYYKGNSALAGKLDSQILDPRLTLRSEPTHRDLLGSSFDGSGLPVKPMTWIDKGILSQLFFDRFTAKERGVAPTPFPGAQVLSFHGPTAGSIDELIAGAKRAVLITNFWYIRSVDPADMTVTGMTRDGTFLVEDGQIVAGVKNFRFHDSPLRCLATVDAATGPMEAVTNERGKMLLPALRLPDFHLSSVTKF